jgi:hypothetical protein
MDTDWTNQAWHSPMPTTRLMCYVVVLLASMQNTFSQSGTRIWTQSRAADFSGNQLVNLVPVQAPGVGIQLSPPLTRTHSDKYDNSTVRFPAKDVAGNYVATATTGGTVYAQRYSAAGIPLGGTIIVNDLPALADGGSRAALSDEGSYIVVWRDANENMQGQIISSGDLKVGPNFAFNDTANYSNNSPVAYANAGDQLFWIFYPLITPQGYKIHVQKRDKSGSKVDATFLLNTGNVTTFEGDPAVAATGGGFTVAWPGSNSYLGSDQDIYLRKFNSSGAPLAATVKVNDDSGANAQYQPVLCTDDSMRLLIAWGDERFSGGSSACICGQLFDTQGMKEGNNVRMTDTLTPGSSSPDVEYSAGQFRLSWLVWNQSLRIYQTMWNAWKVAPATWGMMISSVHDAGPGGTLLYSISWIADGLSNGAIQMKVRSSDALQGLQSLPWHGPTDTASYYTVPGGQEVGSFGNTGRYVQYAAYFNGAIGQSPVLRAVSIVYASLDTIPPGEPSGLVATAGHHSIALSWNANHEPDLAGYYVYRGSGSAAFGHGAMMIVPAGVTSFVDNSTAPDTVYHYAVSAFDSCFNESAPSDEVIASPGKLSLYVAQGGSGAGDGSLMNPFPTIAQALEIALGGDTVIVLRGTFSELLTLRAGVSLVGAGAEQCTFTDTLGVHDRSLVRGFRFNSKLRCQDGRATIADNIFMQATNDPAIDILQIAAPSIVRNLIINSSQYGPGIQDYGQVPHLIRNNIIQSANVGIVFGGYAAPSIINNTIIGSALTAITGFSAGSLSITNNILVSHGSINPSGLGIQQTPAAISYNDIWPAADPPVSGTGNISLDPQFADEGTQNYHILSTSPARNAGSPDPQYNDVDGSRNDMGAYGGPDPFPEGPPAPLVRSLAMTGGSGLAGDTAAVTIRIDDPRGVRGGEFTLEFDPLLLSCARLAPGTSGEIVHDVTTAAGAVSFDVDATGPLQSGEETLVTIYFVMNPKAGAGDASPVTFRSASLVDANHQAVILRSVLSAAISVNQYADAPHHIFVDAINTGTESGKRSHPWKSIMKAMAAAGAGDSILVAGGAYVEEVIMKDSVHLVGSGASVTLLDAPPDQPAILFDNIHSGELSGFTLQADLTHEAAWPIVMCSSSSPLVRLNLFRTLGGGLPGIHCYNGGSPTIQGNYFNGTEVLIAGASPLFDGNVIDGSNGPSGGIMCTGAAGATISRNRIDGGRGSGILLNGGTLTVSNNWITCGAGLQPAIMMMNALSATVRNNIICDSSTHGTGVTVNSSTSVDVVNNTFITHLRGIVETSSPARILNNIITGAADHALQGSADASSDYNDLWNNAANYNGLAPGGNDISKDPQFRNPALGDYRLWASSPCINAGSPAAEFLDRDGSRNDVGAYGGPFADSTLFTCGSTVLSFDSVASAMSDTVRIPLHGINVAGIAGLTLMLSYDPAALRVLEACAGTITKRFAVGMTNTASGHESISLASGRGISDSRGDVFTLVCSVRTDHAGTTVIHCESATASEEAMSLRACTPPGDCRIVIGSTGIGTAGGSPLPTAFRMLQNYPNPFNPATTFVYDVPRTAPVSLTIFDILGRKVATLVDGIQLPGRHTIEWNAVKQASGVYFCRMQAGNFLMIKKLLLIR